MGKLGFILTFVIALLSGCGGGGGGGSSSGGGGGGGSSGGGNVGGGPVSDSPTRSGPLASPSNVLLQADDNALAVYWDAGDSNNYTVYYRQTSHVVGTRQQYRLSDVGQWKKLVAEERAVRITNLPIGRTYEVIVTSTKGQYESEPSISTSIYFDLTTQAKMSKSYTLSVTGVDYAANPEEGNISDCSVTELSNHQDCSHDINDQASYSKISAKGEVLDDSANDWKCIKDNITGLIWEGKTSFDGIVGNGGLHDGDDVYSWYNQDVRRDGGFLGYKNILSDYRESGSSCFGYSAGRDSTYCNTTAFVDRVNQENYCGFNDWRVPNLVELSSIVLYGRAGDALSSKGAFDDNYFAHTNTTERHYWTDSTVAQRAYYSQVRDSAWSIDFVNGNDSIINSKQTPIPVRLVRGNYGF